MKYRTIESNERRNPALIGKKVYTTIVQMIRDLADVDNTKTIFVSTYGLTCLRAYFDDIGIEAPGLVAISGARIMETKDVIEDNRPQPTVSIVLGELTENVYPKVT